MRASLAAVLLLSALAGCTSPSSEDPDVVATFYPLTFATERIAGDDLRVGTLVPAGVEPHDWEPIPSDVAQLAGATVLVQQGAGFEPWLDGLVANLGPDAPRVVDSTEGLDLATSEDPEEPGLDPHTWLDPRLYSRQTERILTALGEEFPAHADAMRERAATLREELSTLDGEMETGLATCEIDIIIANHDAYGYLARRYGFEVEAISGLSPEAEPSPQDLDRVIQVAREHNISIIYLRGAREPSRGRGRRGGSQGADARALSHRERDGREGLPFADEGEPRPPARGHAMHVRTPKPLQPETAPVLRVRDVCVRYGSLQVLDHVSFEVPRGDFVGIVGPNGGGKSSLLKAALGLVPRTCGDVELFGAPVERFHQWQRVGYVPQHAVHVDARFPATAFEVALLGRVEHDALHPDGRGETAPRAFITNAKKFLAVSTVSNNLRPMIHSGSEGPRTWLSTGERRLEAVSSPWARDAPCPRPRPDPRARARPPRLRRRDR